MSLISAQTLSRREKQVYFLIVEDAMSNVDIAQMFGCEVNTVKSYVRKLMSVIGCSSRLEVAVRHYKGLTELPDDSMKWKRGRYNA